MQIPYATLHNTWISQGSCFTFQSFSIQVVKTLSKDSERNSSQIDLSNNQEEKVCESTFQERPQSVFSTLFPLIHLGESSLTLRMACQRNRLGPDSSNPSNTKGGRGHPCLTLFSLRSVLQPKIALKNLVL